MKKVNIKLLLGTLVFVFAITSAFISKSSVTTLGWEYVPAGAQAEDCVRRDDCNTQPGFTCKFKRPDTSLAELREIDNVTIQCGDALSHSENMGVINP